MCRSRGGEGSRFRGGSSVFHRCDGYGNHFDRPGIGELPLNQAWVGGIQLQRDEAGNSAYSGDVSHIGLVADDVDSLLEAAYAQLGVKQAEGKPRNWFVTPFGLTIELNERQ